MHIEFLLEEPSAGAFLQNLLPRIIQGATFAFHPYQGKPDLLGKLPDRLRGYRTWLPDDWRIVVLVDNDRQDCEALKGRLEMAASAAGLATKSFAGSAAPYAVLNRVAIEELEAWLLGDVEAIVAAYPRVPTTLAAQRKFRDPDAVPGGTWEALERVLQQSGYYRGGLPSVEVARNVARHMDPRRNRSRSFQVFREGLLSLRHD